MEETNIQQDNTIWAEFHLVRQALIEVVSLLEEEPNDEQWDKRVAKMKELLRIK